MDSRKAINDLSGGEVAILLSILNRCSFDGQFNYFYSMSTELEFVSGDCGMGMPAIRKALGKYTKIGLIKRKCNGYCCINPNVVFIGMQEHLSKAISMWNDLKSEE